MSDNASSQNKNKANYPTHYDERPKQPCDCVQNYGFAGCKHSVDSCQCAVDNLAKRV